MSIATTDRKAGPFAGDDTTTVFPFEFKVYDKDHLLVILTSSAGAESELVLDKDYSVSLNADQDSNPGGSVTLSGALATGEQLTIITDQPATQTTVLNNMGGFFPKTIEKQLDWLTILIQQIEEKLNRAVIAGAPSDSNALRALGTAAQRANKFMRFDSAGDIELAASLPEETLSPSTVEANLSREMVGRVLYPLSAAEANAQLTLEDLVPYYDYNDVRRFGAVADGVTDCSPAIERAKLVGIAELIFPQGDFLFSSEFRVTTGDSLRSVHGAGRSLTRLVFAEGSNGLVIDREFFQVRDVEVRGSENYPGTVGIVTTRNFIVVRNVFVNGWDIGVWCGSRYYQTFDQVVSTLNTLQCKVGTYPGFELNPPNHNTFYNCTFNGGFTSALLVHTEGDGNLFDRCDFERGAGTINLWTNEADDTWGIDLRDGTRRLTFRDCWIEQCRWRVAENANTVWFDGGRLFGGHGNGGTRSPRVFIRSNDGVTSDNLIPAVNSNAWTVSGGSISASAIETFVLGGVRKSVRTMKVTVNGAAATSKYVSIAFTPFQRESSSQVYLAAQEEYHFAVGFYLAKQTSDPEDDVLFTVSFYDPNLNAIHTEGAARMSLPIIQDRTRAGDANTDRAGWQYVGGFYHLRSGQGVGATVRRVQLTIQLGATAKDYSEDTISVWIAEPRFLLIGQESSAIHAI